MTDLEKTKLCARVMGYTVISESGDSVWCSEDGTGRGQFVYFPILSDAQAMGLVKRLKLQITRDGDDWEVGPDEWGMEGQGPDLNRAIVDCAATMEKRRQDG